MEIFGKLPQTLLCIENILNNKKSQARIFHISKRPCDILYISQNIQLPSYFFYFLGFLSFRFWLYDRCSANSGSFILVKVTNSLIDVYDNQTTFHSYFTLRNEIINKASCMSLFLSEPTSNCYCVALLE